MNKTFLIIGGMHSSGKSLFGEICNSHPDIVITDEFGSFIELNVPYKRHVSKLKSRGLFRNNLFKKNYWSTVKGRFVSMIFFTRYIKVLHSYRKQLVTADVVQLILSHLVPHAKVVGDMDNRYLTFLEHYANIPSLSRVIIYRDCRDVAAGVKLRYKKWSRRKKNHNWTQNINSAEKVATAWVERIEIMKRYTDKIYQIRYEDLAIDPQETFSAFSKWLGVAPQYFPCDMIRDNCIGTYKKGLTDEEAAKVIKIAGSTMAELGYL